MPNSTKSAQVLFSKKRPILAFAHHPWRESQWMNRQQLLSRLNNRGWPIYYSTGALDIWQRGCQAWCESSWFARWEKLDSVTLCHAARVFPRWRKSPSMEMVSIRYHARSTIDRIKKIHGVSPILFCFNPIFWPYIRGFESMPLIFHAYDLFSGQPDWNPEKHFWQSELLAKANLVTASSKYIVSELHKQSGRNIQFLPNGADVQVFSDARYSDLPEHLKRIPKPRIGYCGAVNKKVDLCLVAELSRERPMWNWCFIGAVAEPELRRDPYLAEAFEFCLNAPNIHFLGERNFCDIPQYVAHMDVNIMCYRTDGDGWWKGVYPLKMHEYLATGKPVVSSRIDAVLDFSDNLRLADSIDSWLTNIEQAIVENDLMASTLRVNVAFENSWESRVDQLEDLIMNVLRTCN